jgi:hypothetical protein
MTYDYLQWALVNVLLLLILYRGIRSRMLGTYPILYIYFAFVLIASIGRMLTLSSMGYHSSAYYYLYHLTSLGMTGIQVVVLLEVYLQFVGYSKSSWRRAAVMIILATVVTVPAAQWLLALERGNLFYRSLAVGLSWQVVVCLLVCRAAMGNRNRVIGRNVKGIVGGFGVLTALQAMNLTQYLGEGAPFALFGFLLQFFYILALIFFSWGLWDYDPVRLLEGEEHDQLFRINRDVREVVRTLVLTR